MKKKGKRGGEWKEEIENSVRQVFFPPKLSIPRSQSPTGPNYPYNHMHTRKSFFPYTTFLLYLIFDQKFNFGLSPLKWTENLTVLKDHSCLAFLKFFFLTNSTPPFYLFNIIGQILVSIWFFRNLNVPINKNSSTFSSFFCPYKAKAYCTHNYSTISSFKHFRLGEEGKG